MDRGDGSQRAGRRWRPPSSRAAAAAGVPVPGGGGAGRRRASSAPSWLVVERLEGETIPRKILRDDEWAAARARADRQAGRALAAIHTIDPGDIEGLPPADPLGDPLPLLDALGEVRPALELGVRWLAAHRPPGGPRVTVHGDYRMGNFLVGARRAARRPRLGAGAHRRPRRGHRLAVRTGLALRRAAARSAASARSPSCWPPTPARAARP